jgi:hypothetical protein
VRKGCLIRADASERHAWFCGEVALQAEDLGSSRRPRLAVFTKSRRNFAPSLGKLSK